MAKKKRKKIAFPVKRRKAAKRRKKRKPSTSAKRKSAGKRRKKRKATPAQLRALAKGRAKLKRMRGGSARKSRKTRSRPSTRKRSAGRKRKRLTKALRSRAAKIAAVTRRNRKEFKALQRVSRRMAKDFDAREARAESKRLSALVNDWAQRHTRGSSTGASSPTVSVKLKPLRKTRGQMRLKFPKANPIQRFPPGNSGKGKMRWWIADVYIKGRRTPLVFIDKSTHAAAEKGAMKLLTRYRARQVQLAGPYLRKPSAASARR